MAREGIVEMLVPVTVTEAGGNGRGALPCKDEHGCMNKGRSGGGRANHMENRSGGPLVWRWQ